MIILSLVGFIILIKYSQSTEAPDYYWRDYQPNFTYDIPSDAVPGGRDITDNHIFIGQANVWGVSGVHPCTITKGIGQDVWVHAGGPRKATKFVQILCSPNPENFKWIPATSTTLHTVGINTHIVNGGVDINHVVYVGRAKHQGNVVIGKVYTHDINHSDMVFIFENRKYRVKTYEILTYDTNVLSKSKSKSKVPSPNRPSCFDFLLE